MRARVKGPRGLAGAFGASCVSGGEAGGASGDELGNGLGNVPGNVLGYVLGGVLAVVFAASAAGCASAPPPPEPPPRSADGPQSIAAVAGARPDGSGAAGLQVAGDPAGASGVASGEPGRPGSSDAAPGACAVQAQSQPVRTAGNLTVESPPRKPQREFASRMRTHIDGALTASAQRFWVGMEVPSFVQLAAGTLELFLLDKVHISAPESAAPDGFLAFYRDPYDASSCGLGGSSDNCAYGAALYHCSGKLLWVLTLNGFLSRPDHLEVQDIRYDGGVLYFNEACQSYAKDAGGKCSSLVALDPALRKVLWKTTPLISNSEFLVAKKYIVTGYGFTAEPDFVSVVRRSDGKVMQRLPVSSAPEGMSVGGDGILNVALYQGGSLRFAMDGFEGEKPRLTKVGGASVLESRR